MQEIADYLRAHHPSQTATWASALVQGRSAALPQPSLPAGRRHRHRSSPEKDARYFTGRARALERIAGVACGG